MAEGQEERKGYNPLLKNYPDSVKINKVSIGAETLYTRLLAKSDDYADYDADPRLILAGLYGKRWKNRQVSELKISKWLDELEGVNLVVRYQIDGDNYLNLVDCFKTLRADVKIDCRYPKYSPELVVNKGLPVHGTATGRPRPPNQTRLDQTRPDNIYVIFDYWNLYKGQRNWKSHREITPEIEESINNRLKRYSVGQLKAAITNYADILLSPHFVWSKNWTLREFFTRHRPDDRNELQIYRFLGNNFSPDDFKRNSGYRGDKTDRSHIRQEYEEKIKESDHDKLIKVRQDVHHKAKAFLIDELRPEIKKEILKDKTDAK